MRRLALSLAGFMLAALALAPLASAQDAPAGEPSGLSNLAMWSLIVAAVVPGVVSLLKSTHWPAPIQTAVMFAVSCVAAAGTAYWKSDLNGRTWVESLMVILVGAIAYYHGVWKPSGASKAVEKRTDWKGGR